MTFHAWKTECDRLLSPCIVTNAQEIEAALIAKETEPNPQYQFHHNPNTIALTYKEFNRALNSYLDLMHSDTEFNPNHYETDPHESLLYTSARGTWLISKDFSKELFKVAK